MGTLNEDVRDNLIEQDIRNTRAIGGVQNAVDRRLVQLSRDLRRLIIEADLGEGTPAAKRRKLDRVDEASKPLILAAFQEINAMTRNALGRMAVTDVQAVELAIEDAFEAVPGG